MTSKLCSACTKLACRPACSAGCRMCSHTSGTLVRTDYHPRAGEEGEGIVYGGPLDAALPQALPSVAYSLLAATTPRVITVDERVVVIAPGG